MVNRKEIEHLGELVKIELKDPEKYIKQMEQIINYFESLDKVEISSDEILQNELPLDKLRDDLHSDYIPPEQGKLLIDYLKRDPNQFIRAPKMT